MAVTLFDPQGNPLFITGKPPQGRAGAIPVARRGGAYLGQYDSPEKIKAAWTACLGGDIREIMRVAEELENDLRFLGLIRQRRLAVSRLPWRIEAGGEDAAGQQIAEFCERTLRKLRLKDALEHLQDAVVKPLAALEIIWSNAGPTVPVGLVPRLGTEFNFDYEATGEQLRLITDAARPKGEPIDPRKFIVRWSQEKGATLRARGGLVRGLAGRWLIRNLLWIAWLTACERWGDPAVIGKYPRGTDDNEIAKLEDALANLGRDAAGVVPNDMVIEALQTAVGASGSQTMFQGAMQFLERDIAIGITGETLTSAGSDLGRGAMALGEVHNDIRQELVEADADDCGQVLTDQLLVPLVIYNFGEQPEYPKLVIVADPEEDLQARLNMDAQLVGLGVNIPLSYFHETYDRPEAEAGEPVARTPQAIGQFGLPLGAKKKVSLR